ncbi:MAG: hypothetical protein D0433_03900 [Candidatus Thermochlorobacter aerophilum]|uniref:Uncharacterized protein n=1 Tax=Candidatus Thermochlorobacter aerophilus TaxID=1868324 RepID=A0A395M496_9BACT|nr:MAG: hypothetical protein D0433_03900 [Candidatus Thermochlorobacter aerophilum]
MIHVDFKTVEQNRNKGTLNLRRSLERLTSKIKRLCQFQKPMLKLCKEEKACTRHKAKAQ